MIFVKILVVVTLLLLSGLFWNIKVMTFECKDSDTASNRISQLTKLNSERLSGCFVSGNWVTDYSSSILSTISINVPDNIHSNSIQKLVKPGKKEYDIKGLNIDRIINSKNIILWLVY